MEKEKVICFVLYKWDGKKESGNMFGYVVCSTNELTEEDILHYKEYYCGVCRALKSRFGELERCSLNYDMTFLALVLTALYEPQQTMKEIRCVVHPIKPRNVIENKYIDYAADMTILLAYFKCLDDWNDEHKVGAYCYKNILQKKYDELRLSYPRQCKGVADAIEKISQIEKDENSIPDEAINASGEMLQELFVYDEKDFWNESLRKFGYELGRFIYLMDAAIDYKKDSKTKNYNPLIKMGKRPKEVEDILAMIIGGATEEFEKLPIVQEERIIRNILYSGIWLQYNQKIVEKETKND